MTKDVFQVRKEASYAKSISHHEQCTDPSFFAYKAGVVLGTPFINVLKHLPEFRPYKGHDMLEREDYF